MWSKGNVVTTPNGEVHYRLLSQSCFYCPNLTTVAPMYLEIKRFVTWLWANVINTAWGGVPNETLSMFTCCPNLMFLASLWLRIYRFSNWLFCWPKLIFILLTLSKIELTLLAPFCWLWTGQLFYWDWVSYNVKNNPNPLRLIKIQEPHIGSGTSYFWWFNQWESRTGFKDFKGSIFYFCL